MLFFLCTLFLEPLSDSPLVHFVLDDHIWTLVLTLLFVLSEITALVLGLLRSIPKTKWKVWLSVFMTCFILINIYPFISYHVKLDHSEPMAGNENSEATCRLYGEYYCLPIKVDELLNNGWAFDSSWEISRDALEPEEARWIDVGCCKALVVNLNDFKCGINDCDIVRLVFLSRPFQELKQSGYTKGDFAIFRGILPESRKYHVVRKYNEVLGYTEGRYNYDICYFMPDVVRWEDTILEIGYPKNQRYSLEISVSSIKVFEMSEIPEIADSSVNLIKMH